MKKIKLPEYWLIGSPDLAFNFGSKQSPFIVLAHNISHVNNRHWVNFLFSGGTSSSIEVDENLNRLV